MMILKPTDESMSDEWFDAGAEKEGECDLCGTFIYSSRNTSDLYCGVCKTSYNAFGQMLRYDLPDEERF